MICGPRRTLAGAVLAAAVLLVAAPAEAQLGDWTIEPGSFEAGGGPSERRQISGRITYAGLEGSTITGVVVGIRPTDEALAEQCGTEPTATLSDTQAAGGLPDSSPAAATFTVADVAPFCNGPHVAEVDATAAPPAPLAPVNSPGGEDFRRSFDVARPAPPVTGLTAAVGPDRAVTLTWGVPAGWEGAAPPDFAEFDGAGYVVQRAVGDGPFEQITTTDRGTRTHVDTAAPAEAATARYRVVATRSDGQGNVVEGDFAAAPVTEARLTPEAPPTTPAPPTTRAPAVNAPGRGGGGGARPAPPQTGPQADDVFSETLPFDLEPGEADAVLPEDAAQFLQSDGPPGDDFIGAGILVPSSIAVLLASWALHLRYLARRAAVPV
jgi:hypothetical protein